MKCVVLVSLFLVCYISCVFGGASTNPLPVSAASIAKLQAEVADMTARWEVLDNACDPRAPFALMYLMMTRGGKTLVENLYFNDGNKMADFIRAFAKMYKDAFDAYEAGNFAAVPAPWKYYYDNTLAGKTNVSTDLSLAANAHINYDLAIATQQQQYVAQNRKADFDRVSELMSGITPAVLCELGQRYDAFFVDDGTVLQDFYFSLTGQLLAAWRQGAWVTATSYTLSPAFLRPSLYAVNAVSVAAVAVTLAGAPVSSASYRVSYCQAHQVAFPSPVCAAV